MFTNIFKLMSLLQQLQTLATLVSELKSVRASNPATSPADYQAVAAEVEATESWQHFLARVGESEAAALRPALPAFLMYLDLVIEKA